MMDRLCDQHAGQLEVLRCNAPTTVTGCSEHQTCEHTRPVQESVMLVWPAAATVS